VTVQNVLLNVGDMKKLQCFKDLSTYISFRTPQQAMLVSL